MARVRRTSASAYASIIRNGLLSAQRWLVYKELYLNGPLTGKQVQDKVFVRNGVQAWRRLPELRELGVVEEVGEVRDTESGRVMILWDVTDGLPKDLPKRVKSSERIVQLEQRVSDLEDRLIALGEVI